MTMAKVTAAAAIQTVFRWKSSPRRENGRSTAAGALVRRNVSWRKRPTNAAARFGTAGQRNVQCLFGQTRFQRGLADRFAALVEGGFDGVLGNVDRRAGGFFLLGRQLAQALQELGDLATLAEETGFHLFQRIGVGNGGERRAGFANDLIEIVHRLPPTKRTFQ